MKPTALSGRKVPEWIGATPDAKPPLRVRLRVFERYGGRCHLTGVLIRGGDAWDLDHIKSLTRGGENRESNLAPAIKPAHIAKTAAENSEDARADRIKAKHLGLWPRSKAKLRSRGFAKTRQVP